MKLAPIKALSRRSKVEKLDSCPKKRDAGLPAVNSFRPKAADEVERRFDQAQPERVVAIGDRPRARPAVHRAPARDHRRHDRHDTPC